MNLCQRLDIAVAEAAVERAKAAIEEDLGKEEVAAIQASLQKAMAQLPRQTPPPHLALLIRRHRYRCNDS